MTRTKLLLTLGRGASGDATETPLWGRAWLLDSGVLIGSQVLVLAAGWALALVVARDLGPASYGVFATCFAVAQAYAVIVEAGFTTWLLRELSAVWLKVEPRQGAARAAELGGQAVAVSGILGGTLLGLATLVSLGAGLRGELVVLLLGLMAYTIALTLGFVLEAILRSRRCLREVALATLIEKVALIGGVVIALSTGQGLTGVSLAYVVAGALRLAFDTIALRRVVGVKIASPTRSGMASAVRSSFPFAVNTAILNLATRADPAIVATFTAVGAGYMNIGDRVLVSLLFVPVTASSTLYPHLARVKDLRVAGRQASLLLGGAGAVMALVLVLAAPRAIPSLFGDEFRPAVPVVQTMLLALPLLCFVNTLLTTIYSGGLERRVMAGIAFAMGSGTLALAAGAAIDGARGAAVGYLVRASLVTLAVTWTTTRSLKTV